LTERHVHELDKDINNVVPLIRQPLVYCGVIVDTLLDISNCQHPSPILATLYRDWEKATIFFCDKIIVWLVSTILNEDVIACLS